MKTRNTHKTFTRSYGYLLYLLATAVLYYGCEVAASKTNTSPVPTTLPVLAVESRTATTFRVFNTSLEGTEDLEIRPQVNGYLQKIYIDEGQHVQKGQPLFRIDDNLYRQQLKSAKASLLAAEARQEKAQIDLDKLQPLVQHDIVSDVQLQEAQAALNSAKATVAQAKAAVNTAAINLGYTLIKAPAEGFVGRLPFKTGSLVGTSTVKALTTLSSVNKIYAYFSMSEADFLSFKDQYAGKTIKEKIAQMPPVKLVMPDGTIYPQQGKVEAIMGQFDETMGTIEFRAVFTNTNGLLRSGNTGEIQIPHPIISDLVIPQKSTFTLQDKVFVYSVNNGHKAVATPITVSAKIGHYFLVNEGLKPGQKIVYTGLSRLHEGALIQPKTISLDSLLRVDPL